MGVLKAMKRLLISCWRGICHVLGEKMLNYAEKDSIIKYDAEAARDFLNEFKKKVGKSFEEIVLPIIPDFEVCDRVMLRNIKTDGKFRHIDVIYGLNTYHIKWYAYQIVLSYTSEKDNMKIKKKYIITNSPVHITWCETKTTSNDVNVTYSHTQLHVEKGDSSITLDDIISITQEMVLKVEKILDNPNVKTIVDVLKELEIKQSSYGVGFNHGNVNETISIRNQLTVKYHLSVNDGYQVTCESNGAIRYYEKGISIEKDENGNTAIHLEESTITAEQGHLIESRIKDCKKVLFSET